MNGTSNAKPAYSYSKNNLGYIAIITALIGVFIAIFQVQLADMFFPEQNQSLLEQAANLITDKGSITDSPIRMIFMGLGFIAFVLAIFSFVKQEDRTISKIAAGLAILAIGWEYILLIIVIIIAIGVIDFFDFFDFF